MAHDRILVFAKRPAAGRVKTRLTPPLPPDEAAAVYEACMRDVLGAAARQRARIEIWYHEDNLAEEYFRAELPHIPAHAQIEGDLGAKMADAFERSFDSGAQRVIIIGTDSPTLPESVINSAFDDLHEVDAVIGPCIDGGYYAIGMRSTVRAFVPAVFSDTTWSHADVFKTTLARIAARSLSSRVLPGWYDVDTIEDLRQALADAAQESHIARWAERPEAIRFLNAG